MPKKTCLFSWVSNYIGTDVRNYDLENKSMSCCFSGFLCPSRYLWPVIHHFKASHHIKNLNLLKKLKIRGDEGKLNGTSINLDVTKLFVSCNIPLNVLDHPNFSKFIEKYSGKIFQVDGSLTICRDVCQEVLNRIE
uniref:Uncharacterized protein n=1 Tax=Lepeophtheirus salmonis TaxID=72036 RepID=A0A0K2TPK9_LEPSM